MAQKVRIELVSDISGEVIPEGEGETVSFGIDGKGYEIDLSKKEAEKFRSDFEKYVSVARKAKGSRSGSATPARSTSDKDRMNDIRSWAEKNGYSIASRGRIKADILEAYEKANPRK